MKMERVKLQNTYVTAEYFTEMVSWSAQTQSQIITYISQVPKITNVPPSSCQHFQLALHILITIHTKICNMVNADSAAQPK